MTSIRAFYVPCVFLCLTCWINLSVEEDSGVNQPLNLTIINVTNSSISLRWAPPANMSVPLLEYRVYASNTYSRSNISSNVPAQPTNHSVEFTVDGLESFTPYDLWVRAVLDSREGEHSTVVNAQTDVAPPCAPRILNTTCRVAHELAVLWERPVCFNNSLDYYFILYRPMTVSEDKSLEIETSKDVEIQEASVPVSDNNTYEIKIVAATKSIVQPSRLVEGPPSAAWTVYYQSNCGSERAEPQGSITMTSLLTCLICASLTVFLLTIGVIVWRYHCVCRRCLHAAYYYLDDGQVFQTVPVQIPDWDEQKGAIPLSAFEEHVNQLHADGDIGFSKEYEAIQFDLSNQDSLFTAQYLSQQPENKNKNRYLNILAYDHSRVRLAPVPGVRGSDYINANFIDGFKQANAYIGTQGPLPTTFDCFWRMIWEQRVVIIVMITNLVERGRRKCDMYWPKEGTETYGSVQVTLIKEDIMAMYTVRTLEISHLRAKRKNSNGGGGERIVFQYHYTNWPDHGTPDHPLPVLSFVEKSSNANPSDAGPIVVHCSAGVGRTGTYIVLDAMLKQIRHKGEVSICKFLHHIRNQRNFLVQTEEQYIFIHDALLEAINCSQTHIGQQTMLEILQNPTDTTTEAWKQLEVHFKMVISYEPKDYNLVSANKSSNQQKNRNKDLLPVESSRVYLTPKPGIDGSDYINASWCLGFKKLREFIITQHPLESTVLDFWQMIWDHNAQTIVLLTDPENSLEEYGIFWPQEPEEILDGDSFKVKCIEHNELDGYITRDFTVHSQQDDYELSVRIIQSSNYFSNLESLYKLLEIVQEWHLEYQNGPVVVVDKFGGTEAATFCCLATLSKQLEYENSADVCMYAKMYHNRRPGIWKSVNDYLLLYQALEGLAARKNIAIVPTNANCNLNHSLTNGYTNTNGSNVQA
ncbi:unnamed protein product [Bemisia tabaci]|uniref:Protein-tyrosine-phosphatase n=1 Tax=Bemisia tabaci TaxID=7038 RepID=A0A9P0A6C4_BEMTA|nr:unnamed protein product [Bemisia tabaci]